MPDNPEVEDERPCLHCLMGDLIDGITASTGSPGGEADVIDVSEIMTSLAKIVAEITSGSDAVEGRRIVEELSREISKYDAEYREHAENGTSRFDVLNISIRWLSAVAGTTGSCLIPCERHRFRTGGAAWQRGDHSTLVTIPATS